MNLDELAESQLGPGYGGERVRLDEMCRDIGDSLGKTASAVESMLGTLYWAMLFPRAIPGRLYSRGRAARRHIAERFVSRGAPVPSDRAEPIVVGHGQPTRYSLVLVDPAYEEPVPSVVEISPGMAIQIINTHDPVYDPSSGGARGLRTEWVGRTLVRNVVAANLPRGGRRRLRRNSLVDQLHAALLEYARLQPGGIVLVRQPQLLPTSCFSPASVVETYSGKRSTAGLLIEVPPDGLFVTVASHAVSDDDVVEVAGIPATVVGRHDVTDSCVLRVPLSKDCPLLAKAARLKKHPIQRWSPRAHETASFDGAASGLVHTRIRGHDLSVLFSQSSFASKIYTDADTVEGDSGAALYDSSENVIGFAAYRTAYGDDPSYSIWIWAKQVLEQHDLGQASAP